MNRINNKFNELKENYQTALVGFVTAGDPDIKTSQTIIKAMCDSGVDILELGVPFSDPTADGPVIQRSSTRVLKQGVYLKDVLEMTRELRKTSSVPVILFSYYNPIMAYGIGEFYHDALEAGADGLLVVDLPSEEADELISQWKPEEFAFIRLIAPTTPKARMAMITQNASGFLYLVSKTGVTGSDGLDTTDIRVHTNTLRSVTDLPICVGFGISTPDDVRAISDFADGVVIGSAFERMIEENQDSPDLPVMIGKMTMEFKAATIKL